MTKDTIVEIRAGVGGDEGVFDVYLPNVWALC